MIDENGAGEFNEDDMQEMSEILYRIFKEETNGYEMLFYISYAAAKELLESYARYMNGSIKDAALCWREFDKIVSQLREVVERDEKGY
jgi:predicted ATP-dependent protease